MKKSLALVLLAATAVAIGLTASSAVAQAPAPRAASAVHGAPVALIDVGKIFKENARLKQKMAELTAELQKAEQRFQQEKEEIRKMSEALKDYTPGSRDYENLDRQLIDRKTRFSVDLELQRKEFTKEEAKITYAFYEQVCAEVEAYAAANGIAVVLKYNSDRPDVEKPEELAREMFQKQVLWNHPAINITDVVQEALNRRAQLATPAGRTSFPPTRRQ